MGKEKIYYQMEAASGRTVRVPADKLEKWMEGQDAIRRGEKPRVSEESIAKLSKMLGIPEKD